MGAVWHTDGYNSHVPYPVTASHRLLNFETTSAHCISVTGGHIQLDLNWLSLSSQVSEYREYSTTNAPHCLFNQGVEICLGAKGNTSVLV